MPFARQEPSEAVGTDGDPDQSQGREPDRRRHPPDLAIAALGQDDLDPGGWFVFADADWWMPRPQVRRRKDPYHCRPGRAVVQHDAVTQRFERMIIWRTVHLHPVNLRKLVFRVSNAGLQGPIVCEQEQSFAVVIEPAGSPNARQPDIIRECGAPRAVSKLAQDVERLVEQDKHQSNSVSSLEYGGAQQHRM